MRNAHPTNHLPAFQTLGAGILVLCNEEGWNRKSWLTMSTASREKLAVCCSHPNLHVCEQIPDSRSWPWIRNLCLSFTNVGPRCVNLASAEQRKERKVPCGWWRENSSFVLNSPACCIASSNAAYLVQADMGDRKWIHLGSGICKTKMMGETEELRFLTQEGMFLKSRVLNWKRETKEMKRKGPGRIIRLSVRKKPRKIQVRVLKQHLWGREWCSQVMSCDFVIFVCGSIRRAGT